jgi:hexosaminidase
LFPSPFCHIGFDETYELEMAARAENVAPSQLCLQQLKRVAALVEQNNKRVIMWGDHNIIIKNPEILPGLPAGIIAVPWHNGLLASYKDYLAPFSERHIPQYASTSIYGYVQVFPAFINRLPPLPT